MYLARCTCIEQSVLLKKRVTLGETDFVLGSVFDFCFPDKDVPMPWDALCSGHRKQGGGCVCLNVCVFMNACHATKHHDSGSAASYLQKTCSK